MFIAGCCEGFYRPGIGPGIVILRDGLQTPLVVAPRKAGALLDGQRIGGNVLGGQREQGVDGLLPVLAGSTRDTEDHIDVHIGEPRLAGCGIRRLGICSAMPAAERFEIRVVERLRTKAQAIDATGVEIGKLLRLRGCRVGLDGDFSVGSDAKRGCRGVEYAPYLGWLEDTGRATTEKDCLEWSLRRQILPGTEFSAHSLHVTIVQRSVPR